LNNAGHSDHDIVVVLNDEPQKGCG